MEKTQDQDKIRALHIGIDIGLGYQNLRDATINIQKAISRCIDEIINNENKS